jgi:transcriptional repressor NrdR
MLCPHCQTIDNAVIDSRLTDNNSAIRRRRECIKCKNRFTTFERLRAADLIVVKKDETREQYDREKLERGIWRSCEKRPVTQHQIESLLTKLEDSWSNKKEVSSQQLGQDVMEALKKIDDVAYIRFASVYREFTDAKSFQRAIRTLSAEIKGGKKKTKK